MAAESAYTSTRQIPAFITNWNPERGSTILDIGGGKYDDATVFLDETHGCTNLVLDPFNRPEGHNQFVRDTVKATGCDYIICLNVLNVIQDKAERLKLYSEILEFVTPDKTKEIIFQIYEGDCSGIKSNTTAQMNAPTTFYVTELVEVFNSGWDVSQFRIGSKKNGIRLNKIV